LGNGGVFVIEDFGNRNRGLLAVTGSRAPRSWIKVILDEFIPPATFLLARFVAYGRGFDRERRSSVKWTRWRKMGEMLLLRLLSLRPVENGVAEESPYSRLHCSSLAGLEFHPFGVWGRDS
jgi:hypothetical protein